MVELHDEIDERLRAWIEAQPLFFVASAPADGGHVNGQLEAYVADNNAASIDSLPGLPGLSGLSGLSDLTRTRSDR
jgi:hypothetical protein